MQKSDPLIVNAPQRSEQWFAARLGNVTASSVEVVSSYSKPTAAQMKLALEIHNDNGIDPEYIDEMMEKYPVEFCLEAGIELSESVARETYRESLVAERITKMPADQDKFISPEMRWGQALEREARHWYAMNNNVQVSEAPLYLHRLYYCGASPDGDVIDMETGELGVAEIKCLKSHNHLYKIIRDAKMPDDYFWQVQMQMWITGRAWCDFVGYDSRVGDGLKAFVIRVKRDDFFLKNVFEPMLLRFLEECDHDEKVFYAIKMQRLEKERKEREYREELALAAQVLS